jgi:hypothetical protein
MAGKRKRTSTPQKEGENVFLKRIENETEKAKVELGEALLKIKTGKITDMRDSMIEIFSDKIIPWFESQASTMSDMTVRIDELESENEDLKSENVELKAAMTELENRKKQDEIKNSRAEMEAKIKEASLQVKVMDLDFGSEIKERKDLLEKSGKVMDDRIRSDLKAQYDNLCKKAVRMVMAKQTAKYKVGDSEIWTAPVVMAFKDRNEKWEMEDLLRKSNIFPSYHWPKEMLEPVKKFRQTVRDNGINEATSYIRIRPVEKDGKLRIRAETKPKEGNGKFTTFATWAIPPMEGPARLAAEGWDLPTLAANRKD